jgi:hypothetical protein
LEVENVEALDAFAVLVASVAPDADIAAAAEGPSPAGPLPVRRTTPTFGSSRTFSKASRSSYSVSGRKALRTSGRLKAMRAMPSALWNVMSW